MAPTKVLNCSHGQALSFEYSQWEQLGKGRALRQFKPSGSLKKRSFFKKNFVLYPTKILFNPLIGPHSVRVPSKTIIPPKRFDIFSP